VSNRREAREFCLQFLYHYQLPIFQETKKNSLEPSELFNRILEFKQTLDLNLDADQQAYVIAIVRGILKEVDSLEGIVTKYLKNWKLSRLSKIEHTLLILATYELMFTPETPSKVVINEAIELSKKYSTKESGSFINGILDSILKSEVKA
jgi:transcription antitermination protein NusB